MKMVCFWLTASTGEVWLFQYYGLAKDSESYSSMEYRIEGFCVGVPDESLTLEGPEEWTYDTLISALVLRRACLACRWWPPSRTCHGRLWQSEDVIEFLGSTRHKPIMLRGGNLELSRVQHKSYPDFFDPPPPEVVEQLAAALGRGRLPARRRASVVVHATGTSTYEDWSSPQHGVDSIWWLTGWLARWFHDSADGADRLSRSSQSQATRASVAAQT